MRAVVSKRGVDDGNQKGGGFPQPAQESHYYYRTIRSKIKLFCLFYFLYYQEDRKIFSKSCVNVITIEKKSCASLIKNQEESMD
jgi:hypothetical protein